MTLTMAINLAGFVSIAVIDQKLIEYFKLFGMKQLEAEMCAIMMTVNKIKLENLIMVQCNIK